MIDRTSIRDNIRTMIWVTVQLDTQHLHLTRTAVQGAAYLVPHAALFLVLNDPLEAATGGIKETIWRSPT